MSAKFTLYGGGRAPQNAEPARFRQAGMHGTVARARLRAAETRAAPHLAKEARHSVNAALWRERDYELWKKQHR